MKSLWCALTSSALVSVTMFAAGAAARQEPHAANVLVVTLDGTRWQEVFGGLASDLLTKENGGVTDPEKVEQQFGGSTPEERRAKLMPFLWDTVARQGQVFGDPAADSIARVTNGLRFSYPGYNEMLTGSPDPRISSNDRVLNPNVTVLEWLNRRPEFAGKVAAFASWELLPWIVNEARSGVPSNAAGAPIANATSEREKAINEFAADLPPYWGEERFDAPTGLGALDYLRARRPRVLYVMLGETDEWAHGRRYDLYLDAALTKPLTGHFEKAGVTPRRHLVELRTADAAEYSLGRKSRSRPSRPTRTSTSPARPRARDSPAS